MGKPRPFQFSVGTLLVLTTTVAVVLGVLSMMFDVGLTPYDLRVMLAVYVLVVIIWSVIRGPAVYRNLSDVRRRRRELDAKREALATEVVERKKHSRQPRPASPDTGQGDAL